MVYKSSALKKHRQEEELREALKKVLKGLGLDLLELNVFRSKKMARQVQVKLTVYRYPGKVSVEDCSKAHKAILPRLELAFQPEGLEEQRPDIYVEVASPGIDRIIKEGAEFVHYADRQILCYRTDISDWTDGRLVSSDEEGIVLKINGGEIRLQYEIIGKAKLGNS